MKLRAYITISVDVDTLREASAWEDRIAQSVKQLEEEYGTVLWDIKERRDRIASEDKVPRYRRIDA